MQGDRFAQHPNTCFSRIICRHIVTSNQTRNGRYIHNRAGRILPHIGEGVLTAKKHRVEINLMHFFPKFKTRTLNRAAIPNASIINQNTHSAHCFSTRLKCCLPFRLTGNVMRKRKGRTITIAFINRITCRLRTVQINIRYANFSTLKG